MLNRRRLFAGLLGLAVAGPVAVVANVEPAGAVEGDGDLPWWLRPNRRRPRRKAAEKRRNRKRQARTANRKTRRRAYAGRTVVNFPSVERRGTIIVKTGERALYQIMGGGKARRYLVAVGKEGFAWSGVARVGLKRKNPRWTPPPEMIERTPKYARWANGMPGGIPENPLGVRALYLFKNGRDTMFRIHGTNAPSSIGSAASSGCIRMLNREVTELYNNTPIGTKVIVL